METLLHLKFMGNEAEYLRINKSISENPGWLMTTVY